MAPLSPATSSTMPEGPLSPESAASNSQHQQYPSYEEDETMTDFACAMFSPRNWKGGEDEEQNDVVTDEEKMNMEDDTSPRPLCSCNNNVEGVEPIQYTTKKIAANGSKDDPPSEKSLITPDSEDSEDNTVDDNHKPNDKETAAEESKAKKGVTWVEKNPTPLSPMSYAPSSISPRNNGNKRRGGSEDHASLLSPSEGDEETLTLEENDTLDEEYDRKPTGLLAASKNRRPGSIHNHPAEAKRKQSVVPPTMVDIPDDESEASLLVLMRYMGCTPVAYGEGPLPNNRLDDSGNTRPSFVFGSRSSDEDENSLLSDDDTFIELEKQEIEDIKTSWTMDNNEVGVEMGLSDLVIDAKKEETKKEKKKIKKKSLVVEVEQDISDAPSDEKANATSPLVGSGEAASTSPTSPIVKFATSPNSGKVVVVPDDDEQNLDSKINHGAIASPASSRSFAITSPRNNEEVTKAMAMVEAYKKSMAEVTATSEAAAALSETEKIHSLLASLKTPVSGSTSGCFSRQTSAVPSSTDTAVVTEAALTVVKPAEESSSAGEDATKIKKTSSSRSDKENGGGISPTAELNDDVAATIVKAPLTVDTTAGAKSPQDAPDSSTSSKVLSPTKESVKEVDELLSKTREWLVRHNETQHKKLATPLATPSVATSKESPISSKRKVMGDITGKTGPSVLSPLSLGNSNKGDVTPPKTLDQLLQSKKNGTASSSNKALLSAAAKLASPKSLSASPTSLLSSPTSTTGGGGEPKKSIMEQLEEIRSKQRELEARQKTKQERQQQLQQQEAKLVL